jgi:hypothetical protein
MKLFVTPWQPVVVMVVKNPDIRENPDNPACILMIREGLSVGLGAIPAVLGQTVRHLIAAWQKAGHLRQDHSAGPEHGFVGVAENPDLDPVRIDLKIGEPAGT